jgi:hypothetical protein
MVRVSWAPYLDIRAVARRTDEWGMAKVSLERGLSIRCRYVARFGAHSRLVLLG